MGHFCTSCGAALVWRTVDGRDVEACPNDEFVLWRDPKVAAAVVVEADGGIVLGRRAIEPGYGLWCLPGGFVNHDEDAASAAVRECREEINAEVEITSLLGVYHVPKATASSIIGIAYSGRVVDGGSISAGPEMLEVAVFRPDALPPLAFPSHRQVLAWFAGGEGLPAFPPSPVREQPRPPRTR